MNVASITYKLFLAFSTLLATIAASAQENIFRPENVADITSTPPYTNGDLWDLLTGQSNLYFKTDGPVTVTIQLINPEIVRAYTVDFRQDYYKAQQVVVSASNNGSDFVTLDNKPVGNNIVVLFSEIANNTSYQYYRFQFTGVPNGYLSLSSITGDNDEPVTPVLYGNPVSLGDKADLSWDQVIRPVTVSTAKWQLQRSTDGTNFSLLTTLNGDRTNYTDTMLTRSTAYWYMVRYVTNTITSPFSSAVKIVTADDSLRRAPSLGARTDNAQSNKANLSWWLEIGGPGGFDLERSTDSINFRLLRQFDKSIHTFTDITLQANTTYWYRVKAHNDLSVSPYSRIAKITTINDSLLTAPLLQAAATSGVQANLSWSRSPLSKLDSATVNRSGGFVLERSSDGKVFIPLGLTGRVSSSTLAYTDESLQPNTDYWYRVSAFNYLNSSPYSRIVKIKTTNLTSIPANITGDGGSLSVSAENRYGAASGEGSLKLIDGDAYTKWLVFDTEAGEDLSAVYKPTGTYSVTGYALTTANDAAGRDPRSWGFYGSNDSIHWVLLDTAANQLGSSAGRSTSVPYNLKNGVTYTYYRINFTANNNAYDGVQYQVAEWQIFGVPVNTPAIPSDLITSNITDSSVSLNWKLSSSKPAIKLVLQRSEDGLYFNSIDTLAGTGTTYINKGLYDSTTYFYRIQALGENKTAISGWSNIAKATTSYTAGIPVTPHALSLAFNSDTIVTLRWTDRSFDETGFELERSKDGKTFARLDTIPANVTTYTDSTVWPGNYFYYRIRAVNAKGVSPYSNVLQVLSEGTNTPPMVTDPVIYRQICGGAGTYHFSFSGVQPGPHYEDQQKVTVTSVKANNNPADTLSAQLLTNFTFDPAITNGVANYGFSTTGKARAGDSAIVIVTLKDDGGTNSFGTDSLQIPVKFFFVPFTVAVQADKSMPAARYVLVTLTAKTNLPGASTFKWAGAEGIEGSQDNIILRVRPVRPTTYMVTATSSAGCQATASYTVSTPDEGLIISNAITPNGDGKNDKWIIWGIDKIANNSVKVFDRAGRMVFFQRNYANNWDGSYNGKKLEEGMYYYVVEGDGQKPVTGTLNIIHDHR